MTNKTVFKVLEFNLHGSMPTCKWGWKDMGEVFDTKQEAETFARNIRVPTLQHLVNELRKEDGLNEIEHIKRLLNNLEWKVVEQQVAA